MVYKYSWNEQIIMAVITGSSNLTTIPCLFLIHHQKRNLIFTLSILSLVASILYHVCESIRYPIILTQKKWHEVDNIGAIFCISTLLLSMTKYNKKYEMLDKQITIFFLMSIFFQARGPWRFENTLLPILIVALFTIYLLHREGAPAYKPDTFKKGISFMVAAVSGFIKGLDDGNDYLRIYHSIWHCMIGISFFYLWQVQEKRTVTLKGIMIYMRKFIRDDIKEGEDEYIYQ